MTEFARPMPVAAAMNTTPTVSVVRERWRSSCNRPIGPRPGGTARRKNVMIAESGLSATGNNSTKPANSQNSRPHRVNHRNPAKNTERHHDDADADDRMRPSRSATTGTPSISSGNTSRMASSGDKWLAFRDGRIGRDQGNAQAARGANQERSIAVSQSAAAPTGRASHRDRSNNEQPRFRAASQESCR